MAQDGLIPRDASTATTRSIVASFPKFTELPVELQDKIWDHTIRDDFAAAHFFSVSSDYMRAAYRDYGDLDLDDDSLDDSISKRVQVDDWCSPLELRAPFDAIHGRHSWNQNNPSIYMQDSGLWTACKASRQRMLKYFQPQMTSTRFEVVSRSLALPTSAHIGFRRGKGEQQYLSIRPSTDLLCLQIPRDIKGFDLSGSDEGEIWEALKIFEPFNKPPAGVLRNTLSTRLSTLRHIAVEFDPKWNDHDSPFTYRTFFWVRKLYGLENFWFIDYRLKHRTTPYSDSISPRRKVFHGRQCKFVEVPDQDIDWTYGDADEEPSEDQRWDYMMTFEGTETAHHWAFTCPDSVEEYFFGDYGELGNPHIGVLACIKL